MKAIANPEDPYVLKTKSLFFTRLLPSFCNTASPNLNYTFFIGHDFNDAFFNGAKTQKTFLEIFNDVKKRNCNENFDVQLRLVRCNHDGQPARAQNYALMAAYSAGMDYLYMVNDDTILMTRDWTPRFIEELAQFTPPNVGLVGPNHIGWITYILTYNFVHRTHVDIFKTFYPRNFTDMSADVWISMVYLPNNVYQVPDIRVNHTMEFKTRYNVNWSIQESVTKRIIEEYRDILRSYLETRGIDWDQWVKVTKKKVKKPELL